MVILNMTDIDQNGKMKIAVDKYRTWHAGNQLADHTRLVIRREADKRSFIESTETKQQGKRWINHNTCIDVTDDELRALRDNLNTHNL